MDDKQVRTFLRDGFTLIPEVLDGPALNALRQVFDRVFREAKRIKVSQDLLLQHPLFIQLFQHPLIVGAMRVLFGRQTQMLSLDLLHQGPHSTAAPYAWHRDFEFPGDTPLSANCIIYLDDMTDERGPTMVVPGTHRGWDGPPRDLAGGPLPGQVKLYARAGDMAVINSAIWHSGARNNSAGERRAIYAYYGWWWLKRYDAQIEIPWQARANASNEQLELLGLKMPDWDIHQYDPATVPQHRVDGTSPSVI